MIIYSAFFLSPFLPYFFFYWLAPTNGNKQRETKMAQDREIPYLGDVCLWFHKLTSSFLGMVDVTGADFYFLVGGILCVCLCVCFLKIPSLRICLALCHDMYYTVLSPVYCSTSSPCSLVIIHKKAIGVVQTFQEDR